jgi:hypothetical protein
LNGTFALCGTRPSSNPDVWPESAIQLQVANSIKIAKYDSIILLGGIVGGISQLVKRIGRSTLIFVLTAERAQILGNDLEGTQKYNPAGQLDVDPLTVALMCVGKV